MSGFSQAGGEPTIDVKPRGGWKEGKGAAALDVLVTSAAPHTHQGTSHAV
jgi:hypothetical protein